MKKKPVRKDVFQFSEGQVGKLWKCSAPQKMRLPHIHEELELNLVIRGRGRYFLGRRRYELGKGSLVWLFPEQGHLLVDCSADFEMWIAIFRGFMVSEVAAETGAGYLAERCPSGYFARLASASDVGFLKTVCGRLFECGDDIAESNSGLRYLLTCSARIFEKSVPGTSKDVHPAVAAAVAAMREASGYLSIDEVAERSNLSRSRLSRLFKSQTGIPLVQFRNRLRLENFFSLYGSGHRLNLLEAALQAGFGSYAQFHRIFKDQTGQSPADYRRNMNRDS